MCLEETNDEISSNAYVYKSLQSPDKVQDLKDLAVKMYKNNWSMKRGTVMRTLEGTHILCKMPHNMYIYAIIYSGYYLLLGDLISTGAPRAYIKGLVIEAEKEIHGDVHPSKAFEVLIGKLELLNIEYNVLMTENNTPSLVCYHDPELAPTCNDHCAVYMSDVTFGITVNSCRIEKWSSFSQVTAGEKCFLNFLTSLDFHLLYLFGFFFSYTYLVFFSRIIGGQIEILVAAGITKEDMETFNFIFEFAVAQFPKLREEVFVLLLDGDRAAWAAAKKSFKNVVIILCVYHATENMKKRFGPLCQSNRKAEKEKKWIQCQNELCQKWRILEENINIPDDFMCVTCDLPQDESCEWLVKEKEYVEFTMSVSKMTWNEIWD